MNETPRVVIVGAGPAGIRAAQTLLAHGIRPTLVDEADVSGGQIYRRPPLAFHRTARDLYGLEAAKAEALHDAANRVCASIDYRPSTTVWNAHGQTLDLVGSCGRDTLMFDRLILATGARERVLPFKGWSHAGVVGLGGAQIALKAQGALVGRRIVFAGSGPLLYLVAHQYRGAGATIAAVVDSAPLSAPLKAMPHLLAAPRTLAKGLYYRAALSARGVPVLNGAVPIELLVRDGTVTGLRVRYGRLQRDFDADAVATGYGLLPESQIADLLGCAFGYDASIRAHQPRVDEFGRSSRSDIYLAGDGLRIGGAELAEIGGRLAAGALLGDIGRPVAAAATRRLERTARRLSRFRRGLDTAFPIPDLADCPLSDDTVICRCEDVRAGTLRRAIAAQGHRDLNHLKAETRVGMGRCQGRMCAHAAAEILAAATGRDLASIAPLRGQAPVKPVPLAAVAGEEW